MIKAAVMRARHAPIVQLGGDGVVEPVVQRMPERHRGKEIAQHGAIFVELQEHAVDRQPFVLAAAELATEIAHLAGNRLLRAAFALAGIGIGTAIIAVAAPERLVTPAIAARAMRLRRDAPLQAAAGLQRLDALADGLGEIAVLIGHMPMVDRHVGQCQRRADLVGVQPGQGIGIHALFQALAHHIGLIVVRIAHQHAVMAAQLLSPLEDVGGQKRAGEMTDMQVAVRGRRGDGDNELSHRGTRSFHCVR